MGLSILTVPECPGSDDVRFDMVLDGADNSRPKLEWVDDGDIVLSITDVGATGNLYAQG